MHISSHFFLSLVESNQAILVLLGVTLLEVSSQTQIHKHTIVLSKMRMRWGACFFKLRMLLRTANVKRTKWR